MATLNDDYDTPWKDILEAYFPQFLQFFFPNAYQGIDWSFEPEFLDKELQQIVREAKTGRRHADKLAKVKSLEGHEVMVMVHVEIQGSRESEFQERMYIYNYRFYDRYRKPIVSLALLTDQEMSWRPSEFGYEKWGCKVNLQFPMVKMLDYYNDLQSLEAEASPCAILVLAHLGTQKSQNDAQARYAWKWKVIRLLYEKGYSRQDVLNLFAFIDWIMALPKEFEERLTHELAIYEEEKNMPYITSVERNALEKGMQQGMQKGKLNTAKDMLLEALEAKFNTVPQDIRDKVQNLDDHPKLKSLHREAVLSKDLSDFASRL